MRRMNDEPAGLPARVGGFRWLSVLWGGLRTNRHTDIIAIMAQLIVRNIDEEVVEALKRRAAEHGRSAEAEHRELLREALIRKPTTSFKDHLYAIPATGTDDDFRIRRDAARRVDL